MNPREELGEELFADDRLSGCCVYCGRTATTRDHIPARMFLDEPYPDNLKVVEACEECNSGASMDEEYLACVLECVMAGTTDPDRLRPKIGNTLQHTAALRNMIGACARISKQGITWSPDIERVRRVITKMARGHLAYGHSLPGLETPPVCDVFPLSCLQPHEREMFESLGPRPSGTVGWSEIGSRAFIRECLGVPMGAGWTVVQAQRYRYAIPNEGEVRIVLGEYLGGLVKWD